MRGGKIEYKFVSKNIKMTIFVCTLLFLLCNMFDVRHRKQINITILLLS